MWCRRFPVAEPQVSLAGSGHGRVVGAEEELTADDASLVASHGMVFLAWLRRYVGSK